jgi:hypothetical protein
MAAWTVYLMVYVLVDEMEQLMELTVLTMVDLLVTGGMDSLSESVESSVILSDLKWGLQKVFYLA